MYDSPANIMRPSYEEWVACKICPAIGTPVSALQRKSARNANTEERITYPMLTTV
jgi:hypothetical protein